MIRAWLDATTAAGKNERMPGDSRFRCLTVCGEMVEDPLCCVTVQNWWKQSGMAVVWKIKSFLTFLEPFFGSTIKRQHDLQQGATETHTPVSAGVAQSH
jgi:hypothetical protein